MAKEDNLKPGEYKLSQEEAKKGGINSGIVRKEKATFKKAIKWLLEDSDIKIKKGDIKERFKEEQMTIYDYLEEKGR